MKKEYGYILIVYLLMQLSSFIGVPLVYNLGVAVGVPPQEMKTLVPGYWLVISFSLAFVIILLILRKTAANQLERNMPLPFWQSSLWAFIGVFLALFAQRIAIAIETAIGVEMGSENTQTIMDIIDLVPAAILSVAVFGPILEEIVFRKIIFGALYERFSFSISALISSLIFAVAHMELEHLLLYSAMGFTFAFLYVKTKRLLVPIFAHVTMNSFVVLVQYFFKDEIERMMKEAEQIQNMITWFV